MYSKQLLLFISSFSFMIISISSHFHMSRPNQQPQFLRPSIHIIFQQIHPINKFKFIILNLNLIYHHILLLNQFWIRRHMVGRERFTLIEIEFTCKFTFCRRTTIWNHIVNTEITCWSGDRKILWRKIVAIRRRIASNR